MAGISWRPAGARMSGMSSELCLQLVLLVKLGDLTSPPDGLSSSVVHTSFLTWWPQDNMPGGHKWKPQGLALEVILLFLLNFIGQSKS